MYNGEDTVVHDSLSLSLFPEVLGLPPDGCDNVARIWDFRRRPTADAKKRFYSIFATGLQYKSLDMA